MMADRRWLAFVLAITMLTAACDRGPGRPSMRDDLQRALDDMDKDLLRIVAINSQGSAPGPTANAIIAYVNLSLELQRDHDFGDWNGPTVGTLASTLGATDRGVRGIRDGGNAAGDRLLVYASAIYARHEEGWRYGGGADPAQGVPDAPRRIGEAPSLAAQLEEILARTQANAETSRARLLERKLSAALADVKREIAALELGAVVAGGPAGGEYAKISEALAQLAVARGMPLVRVNSAGSVENARLVDAGDVALGLVQSDVLALAFSGKGPFAAGEPLSKIVTLAALYPEPVHVVVAEDSSIAALGDLAGKRVAVGEPASGTRHSARQVLQAHGLVFDDLAIIDESDLERAASLLEKNKIDAMFVTIGAPAGELRRLASRRAIRLIGLDESAITNLVTRQRSYVRHAIARGTYRGQSSAVRTVATTAVLVTRTTTEDDFVKSILRVVFFELDYQAAGSFQGGLISPKTALRALPIPLHPAAEDYYAEITRPYSPKR